jgi:hypothetical protein
MSIDFLKENFKLGSFSSSSYSNVCAVGKSCRKIIKVNGVSIVCEKIAYEGRVL